MRFRVVYMLPGNAAQFTDSLEAQDPAHAWELTRDAHPGCYVVRIEAMQEK
jgi:hypothetical protein